MIIRMDDHRNHYKHAALWPVMRSRIESARERRRRERHERRRAIVQELIGWVLAGLAIYAIATSVMWWLS